MKDVIPLKPLVFICSPLAGNIELNMQNARSYSRFAASKGMIPFAPHLLFTQFLNDLDEEERALGMSFGLALLDKCDSIWVFGGKVTKGMRMELEAARENDLWIKYFDADCMEVSPYGME